MIIKSNSVLSFSADWVKEVEHVKSPDHGGKIDPHVIVMHYTGSGNSRGTVDWLTKKDDVYLSAHFVIGRDGFTTQLVSCMEKAFHAGKSTFKEKSNVNDFSIGLELINYGPLKLVNGAFVTEAGKQIPSDQVVKARHKNEQFDRFWQTFSGEQIEAAAALVGYLCFEYGILSNCIVGHEDIAPSRKIDPGPAFPWKDFISSVEEKYNTLLMAINEKDSRA